MKVPAHRAVLHSVATPGSSFCLVLFPSCGSLLLFLSCATYDMPGDVRDRHVPGEIIPGTDVLGDTGDSQLKHWKGGSTVYVKNAETRGQIHVAVY